MKEVSLKIVNSEFLNAGSPNNPTRNARPVIQRRNLLKRKELDKAFKSMDISIDDSGNDVLFILKQKYNTSIDWNTLHAKIRFQDSLINLKVISINNSDYDKVSNKETKINDTFILGASSQGKNNMDLSKHFNFEIWNDSCVIWSSK